MSGTMDARDAMRKLIDLSCSLEGLSAQEKKQGAQGERLINRALCTIYARAFSASDAPFVAGRTVTKTMREKEARKVIPSGFSKPSKVTCYNLQDNLVFLRELTEIIQASPISTLDFNLIKHRITFKEHFQDSIPLAVYSLFTKLHRIIATAALDERTRKTYVSELDKAQKIFREIKIPSSVDMVASGSSIQMVEQHAPTDFVRVCARLSDWVSSNTSPLSVNSFSLALKDNYSTRVEAALRAFKEVERSFNQKIDELERAYPDKRLQAVLERMEVELRNKITDWGQQEVYAAFAEIGDKVRMRIASTKSFEEFNAHSGILDTQCKSLLALKSLTKNRHVLHAFSEAFHSFEKLFSDESLPKILEFVEKESFSEIQKFSIKIMKTESVAELIDLLDQMNQSVTFFESVVKGMKGPKMRGIDAGARVLQLAIGMIHDVHAQGSERLKTLKKSKSMDEQRNDFERWKAEKRGHVEQTISGSGSPIILEGSPGATVTINNYSGTSGSGSAMDFVSQYGYQMVLVAVSLLSSGISLGWSLIGAVGCVAGTSALQNMAQQYVPRAFMPMIGPLISLSVWLAVSKAGGVVGSMLQSAPSSSNQAAVAAQVSAAASPVLGTSAPNSTQPIPIAAADAIAPEDTSSSWSLIGTMVNVATMLVSLVRARSTVSGIAKGISSYPGAM